MNRLASRLGISRSSKPPTFKEWSEGATTDDFYDLFTEFMKSGSNDGQSAAFTPSQLEFLDGLLSVLPTDTTGQILIDGLQDHLTKSHPLLSDEITAAASTISLLLHSHACFPFTTPVLLTQNALIRAIGLLTKSSDYMFSQSADIGKEPAIRARSKTARMDFLFSALARPDPPTGVPTKDDVLDILCRSYSEPPSSFSPTMFLRRPITDLEPMAERLLSASSLPSRNELRVLVADLRPLADICYAMRNDKGAEAEKILSEKESLDRHEFREWAKAVSLPTCLDKLFVIFYTPLE